MKSSAAALAPLSVPAPSAAAAAAPAAPRGRGRAWLLAAGALALAGGAVAGYRQVSFARSHETTENAQVDGHVSPLLPRVPGYVARVLVEDNARVAAGQPLIELDPAELDLKAEAAGSAVAAAQAVAATARAVLDNARAARAVAAAGVAVAQVAQAKAAADLVRDEGLVRTGAIADQALADSRAAAASAAARLEEARRQGDAAAAQVAVAAAQLAAAETAVAQRGTDAAFARLQRSYATLRAPIAGIVSHKNVEPGQFVEAGQTLLSVTAAGGLWVVANYKETQVARMRPGQAVALTVDAVPGRTFRGRIDSLAGATGARFALLPPDNASGNFVKVTQRVPVKIAVLDDPPAASLRPGLSVTAVVDLAP